MTSFTTRACRCLTSSLERLRFAGIDFPWGKASSAICPSNMQASSVSKFSSSLESFTPASKMSFASTTSKLQTRVLSNTQASLELPTHKSFSQLDMRQIRGICSTSSLSKSPLEAGGKAKPYS